MMTAIVDADGDETIEIGQLGESRSIARVLVAARGRAPAAHLMGAVACALRRRM